MMVISGWNTCDQFINIKNIFTHFKNSTLWIKTERGFKKSSLFFISLIITFPNCWSLQIIIMTAVISTVPYLTSKGEHTLLYKFYKNVWENVHSCTLPHRTRVGAREGHKRKRTEFKTTCCDIVCGGEFLTQFWQHRMLESWPKVFVLTWGIRSIHVSTEQQNWLEGVYTARSES